MATYPTGWLRLPTDAKDFKERFAWSHVKAIFYDKAKNILLKDKLDAMDKLISDHADAIANKLMTNDAFNTAIADYVTKSMMSGVQVNDGDHVPTSALAYAMQQAITANANAITKLNSELSEKAKITNISSLSSIGDIFKTYSKNGSIPVIGIINWDATLAPDQNVTIAFVWNYLIVAISSSGCIYTSDPSTATWKKRN
jgi:hypothetical protein